MKKRNSQRCKCRQMAGGPAAADPGAERKVGKSRGGGYVLVGFGRGKIEVGIQGTRKSSLDWRLGHRKEFRLGFRDLQEGQLIQRTNSEV